MTDSDPCEHVFDELDDERADNKRLRAALQDLVEHANPIAEDDDGFVAVGYTVTVGAVHRAIAVLQGADYQPRRPQRSTP